jgi:hypothetical protein
VIILPCRGRGNKWVSFSEVGTSICLEDLSIIRKESRPIETGRTDRKDIE